MNTRNSDIEVLRAVAVIYVVIHHAYGSLIPWRTPQMNQWFGFFGGWSGVDLFFAISGFVIARSLIPRLEDCRDRSQFWTTSLAFWVRRYWRLLPSAWLWVGLVLVCCVFFNSSGAFGSFKVNLLSGLSAILQVANFYLAATFGTPGGAGALFHLWSLSLEEQFYLLLPIVILVSGRWLPCALGIAVLLQLASSRSGIYEMMLRTDGILLGVLLAMFSNSRAYTRFEPVFLAKYRILKLLLLGALLLSLAVIGGQNMTVISHRVSMITLISILLVFIASYDKDYLLKKGRLKQVLLWVGSRSYAIYLIHIPVFYITREIWFRIGEPASPRFNPAYLDQLVITAIVLLLLLSELNYRLVEMPLRMKGRAIAQRMEARTNN